MTESPGETRQASGTGAMSVEQIEHELGQLRMNEDGTLGLRASVLNLVVVADDASAGDVTASVSGLANSYPSRAIVLISDPEDEAELEVQLSAFCNIRGGGRSQVCAEQVTIHAAGSAATHLDSFAGPLLIPDLPVFLWYPGAFSPSSPEFGRMKGLADRLIVDSAGSEDDRTCMRELAGLLDDPAAPAVGDIQWVALSPWRSLISELFSSPGRADELDKIRDIEASYTPDGEVRAMLLLGWLASTLDWKPKEAEDTSDGRKIVFSGPSGEVTVTLTDGSSDSSLRRVRLYTDDLSFQVSRHKDQSDATATVMRDDELLGERTVRLGQFDLGVLLGEELQYRGHDTAYEAALRAAVEVMDL